MAAADHASAGLLESPEARAAHIKATRADWLIAARNALIQGGVAEVKIQKLGMRLGVSRSSFYWYFESRQALLDALLDDWRRRNTARLVAQCSAKAATITEATCNFFRCFVGQDPFDPDLEFAIRDWGRTDPPLGEEIAHADGARLDAIRAMFARYGYPAGEADTRARILYYMQLGYHALDPGEEMEQRLSRVPGFLVGFTGREPKQSEIDALRRAALDNPGQTPADGAP